MRPIQIASIGLALASSTLPALAQGATTRLVSVDSAGNQGNGPPSFATLARGGGFVAFSSYASNLVVGDTNGVADVFVHDLSSGSTTRESVSSSGAESHASTSTPSAAISADGRFVAFSSDANDLVAVDHNAHPDVFLRDRLLGTTVLVSVASNGGQGNSISEAPTVSDDGRFVAFHSYASNLDSPDTNGTWDAFVRDVTSGTTRLVGLDTQGAQAIAGSVYPLISGNGRYVAFTHYSVMNFPPLISQSQIYVRDLLLGTSSIESVSSAGVPGNFYSGATSISTDGRFVSFESQATNLVAGDTLGWFDGFVRDRTAGTTRRVSVGYGGAEANGHCSASSVTDDGRFSVFGGNATNILPFDNSGPSYECWIRDLVTGDNVSVGVDTNGRPVFSGVYNISADGRVALFAAPRDHVAPGDNNGFMDLFVRIAPMEAPTYFCTPKVNSLGCTPQIQFVGNSSASQSSGFQIQARSVRNRRAGLLLYSVSGRAALPFGGGTLCLATVHRNTPGSNAGGSGLPVDDCSGGYSLDMNAFAQGLLGGPPLPALSIPGTKVQCQWFSRDPGFAAPNAIGLTGAIEYTVGS